MFCSFRVALLCFVLPLAAVADAAEPAPAAGGKVALTGAQRQKIAIDHVTAEVTPWVPENQKLIVRSAVVPFSGNPRNEMTGDGPIEVYVKQKLIKGSAIEKAAHTFSKYANRKFSVNVCADGQACVLAQESLAPQAKIGRAIQSVLPARQLVNDVVRSGKGSELTAWLIGGGGMSQVHAAATGEHTALVMAAGGMIVKAASTIASAAKAQAAVRQQAFKSTLTWIDETKAAEGAYPYLGQAYKRYKDTLENLSPGALPLDMTQFAQQLSINNR